VPPLEMTSVSVLMVAEKPSIAATLTAALCEGGEAQATKRRGVSPSSPVHEYSGHFMGRPAHFRVTATTGHIFSLDFHSDANDWNKVQPVDLFHVPTVHCYDSISQMPEHISKESKNVDVLVLWLDCDREGENICFEVMGRALPNMSRRHAWPNSYDGCVYRAHFSSLAADDLRSAMTNLGIPDINMSASVDARQEIDLRLGVAFSRLQTMYFRAHFGNQLGKKMVTYGPCQFPTLWFCVQRHCEIDAFVPIPYWTMAITVLVDGVPVKFKSDSGDLWDEEEARELNAHMRRDVDTATILKGRTWRSRMSRPLPLNTVALLKMASTDLGLGPGDAMHLAEQLYLKGILSYPRTETDKYPPNFDLEGTLQSIGGGSHAAPSWTRHARQVIAEGMTPPRQDGTDVGDHPPITPVKLASQNQCGGEAAYALYEAICCHFISTVSPDALFDEAELRVDAGGRIFVSRSSRCCQRGWLEVESRSAPDEGPVDLRANVDRQGETMEVRSATLTAHFTRPPGHLTESELLGLMDRHGIGTDASMAQHISNVAKRGYVELDTSTRQLIPSALGLALAHAYALIDQGLVLPSVRARIENSCSNVAKGLASKDAVVTRTLRIFERKLTNFAMSIDKLPLMLAVAYAKERGSNLVAGDAAGEGVQLWKQAELKHQEVTLERLLEEKDRVELEDDQEGPVSDKVNVMEKTDAVLRVQQALEELGFGSAGSSSDNKGRAREEPGGKSRPHDSKGGGKGAGKNGKGRGSGGKAGSQGGRGQPDQPAQSQHLAGQSRQKGGGDASGRSQQRKGGGSSKQGGAQGQQLPQQQGGGASAAALELLGRHGRSLGSEAQGYAGGWPPQSMQGPQAQQWQSWYGKGAGSGSQSHWQSGGHYQGYPESWG